MIQTNHTTNNFFIKILRSPVLSIGRIKTWGKRKMQKQNSNLATYGLCLFTWEKIRKKMAKKNNSHGFYHFPVFAEILLFFYIRPDSSIFTYSHWFYPFPVLAGQFFNSERIIPICGIRRDFTIFLYSPGFFLHLLSLILPFSGTRRTVFQYSHEFYHFPVFNEILRFFGIRPDSTIFI